MEYDSVNKCPLFKELASILKLYKFPIHNFGKVADSDLKEKELAELVNNKYKQGLDVYEYCDKYNLSIADFLTLAKTLVNCNFYIIHGISKPDDCFFKDLLYILRKYNLNLSYEYVKEYRKIYSEYKKSIEELNDQENQKNSIKKLIKKIIRD